jgi:hypothetical protein
MAPRVTDPAPATKGRGIVDVKIKRSALPIAFDKA